VNGYLLDTNVVAEIRKGERANPGVRAWLEEVPDTALHLSVLVLGEIRKGIDILARRDARAASSLERWLAALERDHGERILPVDRLVAVRWGALDASGPLPAIDGLLAATALVHDLVLVTRNVKDIARTGVARLDPFASTRR
jgi:predicted nucleic acid-binding protein